MISLDRRFWIEIRPYSSADSLAPEEFMLGLAS